MYSAICSGSRSCPGLEATCLTAICIPPAAFQIPSPLDIFYLVSVILQQLFDSFSGFFLLNRQTNWIHTLPPFQTSGICPLFSNTFSQDPIHDPQLCQIQKIIFQSSCKKRKVISPEIISIRKCHFCHKIGSCESKCTKAVMEITSSQTLPFYLHISMLSR